MISDLQPLGVPQRRGCPFTALLGLAWTPGTRVHAYLPVNALRVLMDTAASREAI